MCGLLFTSIYMASEPRKGRVPIRIDRRKLLWRIGPLGKRGVKKGHKTATFVKVTWKGFHVIKFSALSIKSSGAVS